MDKFERLERIMAQFSVLTSRIAYNWTKKSLIVEIKIVFHPSAFMALKHENLGLKMGPSRQN